MQLTFCSYAQARSRIIASDECGYQVWSEYCLDHSGDGNPDRLSILILKPRCCIYRENLVHICRLSTTILGAHEDPKLSVRGSRTNRLLVHAVLKTRPELFGEPEIEEVNHTVAAVADFRRAFLTSTEQRTPLCKHRKCALDTRQAATQTNADMGATRMSSDGLVNAFDRHPPLFTVHCRPVHRTLILPVA